MYMSNQFTTVKLYLIFKNNFSSEIPNGDDHHNASNTEVLNTSNELAGLSLCDFEDSTIAELEMELKVLTLDEYKRIVQLIPLVEKYRNTIKKMENVIKSKNAKIKELEREKLNECINVSKLSAVSVQFLIPF